MCSATIRIRSRWTNVRGAATSVTGWFSLPGAIRSSRNIQLSKTDEKSPVAVPVSRWPTRAGGQRGWGYLERWPIVRKYYAAATDRIASQFDVLFDWRDHFSPEV
jgi:hypothetical protein